MNDECKELIRTAMSQIRDGQIERELVTLERTVDPKWGSTDGARHAYHKARLNFDA